MSIQIPIHVAVFASGAGSNADALIRYEQSTNGCHYTINLIVTNKPSAGVIDIAKKHAIPYEVIHHEAREEEKFGESLYQLLQQYHIDVICLAGYMRKIPRELTSRYPNRILNIHPALLPRFGGKGMYGTKVFEAILESKASESGISIHFVNDEYDEGQILFQQSFSLADGETIVTLAQKTHELEHKCYPEVLDSVAKKVAPEVSFLKKNTQKENL